LWKTRTPLKSGNSPGGTAPGVSSPGQVGVVAPNAASRLVSTYSVCCCSPLVVTVPTCDNMFCRAEYTPALARITCRPFAPMSHATPPRG
jgi:hypothetical protein